MELNLKHDLVFDGESLSAMAAQYIAGACVQQTLDTDSPVAVVVLDRDGAMKAAVRMDEVPARCIAAAERSAKAALSQHASHARFDAPRSDWVPVPDVVPAASVPGHGRVLTSTGRVVGAVGVSGSTSAYDAKVVSAGVRALEMLVRGSRS